MSKSSSLPRNRQCARKRAYCLFLFALACLLPACAPASATPFIAPTARIQPTLPATEISLWTPTVTRRPATVTPQPELAGTPTPEPASPTPECASGLTYLEDLNYPDGTLVAPGAQIEKQWKVLNSGDCDWDSRFRLRLVEGYPSLGAAAEQALFPTRAGQEAVIQVIFSAPLEAGVYRSAWQAYDAQGQPFGDAIFVEFIVQ
jgi:hypothetical protein